MEQKTIIQNAAFVASVGTYHTGGGCMVDIMQLHDGRVMVISDEYIGVYQNIDAFFDSGENDNAGMVAGTQY